MYKGKIRAPRRPGAARPGPGGTDAFQESWQLIRDALNDIHNQNAGRLSFEQLYRASYKAVLLKRGDDLYAHVRAFEEEHFSTHVIPSIWALVTRPLVAATLGPTHAAGTTTHSRRELGERLLRGVRDIWERHSTAMNMVADVLMYLDRGYAETIRRPYIYATTIGLFRDHVLLAPLPEALYAGDRGDRVTGDTDRARPTVYSVLAGVVLDQIDMDRGGEIVDRPLLRSAVAMLESIYKTDGEEEGEKLYTLLFEPQFLASAEAFYRAECAALLAAGDAAVWLQRSAQRLREESARCGHTVSQETAVAVRRIVEQELVVAHLRAFLDLDATGLQRMVDGDSHGELRTLYELVDRAQGGEAVLLSALEARILATGRDIDKALRATDFAATAATVAQQHTNAAIRWVSDILALKTKYQCILRDCFAGHKAYEKTIASSITALFRLCARSAEYVSLYIDDCFKRGLRGKSDAEVDAVLDSATVLAHHVTEKDMLQRYYQKHLARRLLHNKTESPEAEKTMVARMQGSLGRAFTARFEGMFKDMATSAELTSAYEAYVADLGSGGSGSGVSLVVSVLTTNNWPPEVMGRVPADGDGGDGGGGDGGGGGGGTRKKVTDGGDGKKKNLMGGQCTYPPEIVRLQQSFNKFYLRNRTGRVLSWVGSAGSADVRCVFPAVPGHDKGPLSRARRYELSVTTHGMVVLMLFNDTGDDALSFDEIQERTSIPAAELTRTLASLSIPPKCRVLAKTPLTKSIRPGDVFAFNAQFVSKTLRIKMPVVNAASRVEGDDERRATEDKNNQTRAHTIDAAVVRIMKERRVLTHNALLSEVVAQLATRFRPEVSMIKQRIEDLLQRDYMERIEDQEPPSYRYIA